MTPATAAGVVIKYRLAEGTSARRSLEGEAELLEDPRIGSRVVRSPTRRAIPGDFSVSARMSTNGAPTGTTAITTRSHRPPIRPDPSRVDADHRAAEPGVTPSRCRAARLAPPSRPTSVTRTTASGCEAPRPDRVSDEGPPTNPFVRKHTEKLEPTRGIEPRTC